MLTKLRGQKLQDKLYFFIFILPAFVLYFIFFVLPFFKGIFYSFTDWNGITPKVPIQIKKYDMDNLLIYSIPIDISTSNFRKRIIAKLDDDEKKVLLDSYRKPLKIRISIEKFEKIINKIKNTNDRDFILKYYTKDISVDKKNYVLNNSVLFNERLKIRRIFDDVGHEKYIYYKLNSKLDENTRNRISNILISIRYKKKVSQKIRENILSHYAKSGNVYRLKSGISLRKKNRLQRKFKKVGYSSIKFIGLKNFIDIFSNDQRFPRVMGFTLFFTFFNVLFINIFGLLIALLLDTKLKTKTILRTMFFMPNVLSLIIVAFVWSFIYKEVFSFAYSITHIPLFNLSWLGDPKVAPFSVIITSVWQGMGYIMVIYLAGLQSIPKDIMEVAEIDGASGLKKFFYITLPLLMPAMTVSFFITLTNSLKTFEIMLALTNGGPGSATESYVLNIYNDAFAKNLFGYATAKGIILFLIIMFVTVFQLTIMKKKEVEY